MRAAAFTVDVDRDVNMARRGCLKASSTEGGDPCPPRFTSSARGLRAIVGVLEELDVKATFFMEAETAAELRRNMDMGELLDGHEVASHGMGHEDLTGKDSGYLPTDGEVRHAIGASADMLEDIFGARPRGFRAPYLHFDDRVLRTLGEEGYAYDSSTVETPREGVLYPRRMWNGVVEFPVLRCRDASGRALVAYLWPLHEGNREVEDYDVLLNAVRSGITVLATHSWHMVETFSSGRCPEREEARSRAHLKRVLERLGEAMELTTLDAYRRRYYSP